MESINKVSQVMDEKMNFKDAIDLEVNTNEFSEHLELISERGNGTVEEEGDYERVTEFIQSCYEASLNKN